MGTKIALIVLSVMVVGLLFDRMFVMGRVGGVEGRLNVLEEEGDRIVEEMNLRDYDGRVRDSVMMLEIGRSEERLERWMVLRAESWTKASLYKDSIEIERKKRKEMVRSFMEW